MPTGQRASFLDGGEQANAVRPARGGGWLGHRLRQSSASRPSATSSGRPRLDSLRARRDPSSQFASRSASLSAQRAQQQRSKERYHFSQVYESRPRFPEEPFASSLQGLEIDSRWARLHHALLPLLVFYHIPLTLFLDFHALFALVEVAVHPDSGQAGATTAWWVAVGIYAASLALWFVGVVIIYEALWQYARRWSVGRPLALPVYLSAPARNLTSIRSFSLFSLLHSARVMAARRDFAIETFWFYSQNWPTVLTLLPRAALCVVLLVLYRTSGPPLATEGTREATIFNAATGRLTTYTFVILLVNAAWAAWRLAVLVASWIGLLVMLGWRSVSERNKDGYSFGSLAGPEHRREGSRRHLFQASDLEDERAHPSDAADAIHQLPRWAWKLRAEDRLRTLLLDASSDAAGDLSGDGVGYGDDPYATRPNSEMVETARWSRLYPADDQPTSMAQVMREGGADADHQMAGHRGQTDPPPAMAPGGGSGLPVPAPAIAFPQDSFDDRDPLDDRLPARAAGGDDASDHYSPVPTPIGRTTRSREQLRSDSLGRAAAWTTLPATASASMPAGADLDLPDRHYGEGSNDDYALYRPTPPTFEPITLASSEDASPDEPSPSDSPILSGRRRIVSMQSSDLHSTNAVLSDMSSPVATRRRASRGQKRPRSSPSAEGHDPEAGATSGAEASQRQGSADVDDAAGSEVGHGAVQGAQGPRGQEHGDVVVNLVEVPLTPAAFSRDAASIILRQSRTRSKDAVADGAESQAPAESRKGSQRAPPSPRMDALLGQDDKATSSPSGSHGFHKLDGSPNLDNGSFSDVKHGNNGGSVSSTMGLGLMGQGSLPRKWPARRWSLTGSRPQSGEGAPSAEASSGAGAGGSKTSPLPSFAGLLPFGGSRNSSRKNVTALDGGASSDELHGVDPEQSRRAGRDSWLSGKDGSHPGSRQSGGGGDGWWTTLFGSTSSISLSRRTELAADVTVATPEKGSPSRRQEQMDPQPSPPSAAAPSWHSTPKASRPTLGADPMPALAGQPLPATPMANATTTTMAEADADAPAGAGAAAPARAALMARTGSSDNSRGSQDSTMSDDSEEGRLWASFPDQSRRHPPGLIALSIEQQIAEARAAAAAYASSLSPSSAAEDTSTSTSTPRPVSIASPALATPPPAGSSSPHMASLSSSLSEMPLSPSLGGLHAIREESWSSSLESGADTSASDAGDESRPSLPRRRGVLHDEPLEHLTNGPERSEAEVATPRH
ncbi:uncharacterized protein PFL1_03505 [Pseudozyma flocculosa PF-1]|nr:uncharacterized protein PFL1_03505 [Pseudozyma flocculosa PF-1]EPQ29218.1 hypothetical protein PFL1_03505 [Pseudozyma flocculosa PF-1]